MKVNFLNLFIIAIFALVLFSGVQMINTYTLSKGMLDESSVNMVLMYDNNLNTFVTEYNKTANVLYKEGKSQIEEEADVNAIEAFVREFGEHKAKVNTLKSIADSLYSIPDMILLSIPFVNENDVKFYKGILLIIIVVISGIALIKALFGRNTDS